MTHQKAVSPFLYATWDETEIAPDAAVPFTCRQCGRAQRDESDYRAPVEVMPDGWCSEVCYNVWQLDRDHEERTRCACGRPGVETLQCLGHFYCSLTCLARAVARAQLC
ncbi:MAG: hypothetical protein QMD32_06730 [Smithellaceae bacterium]|nr:hypothetical protein [Smithellaceae bacterium]